MHLEPCFFDGTRRPPWAGPVSVRSTPRSPRRGVGTRLVQAAGLVLPVHVPPGRAGPGPHTGGMGLGFPDLGQHLLRHPELAASWAGAEETIARAAQRMMGWPGAPHPRRAGTAPAPVHALRLHLARLLPREGEEDGFGPGEYPLHGILQKLLATRDVTGRRLRMQRVDSPAAFRVSATSAHFSRDPERL